MPRRQERSGSARMLPCARLVGLIGEELMSVELVAVVELVKNAYDTDATRSQPEVRPASTSVQAPVRSVWRS